MADAEALRRAAVAYSALGESGKAADVLQKLVEKEPSDSSAWQLLVSTSARVLNFFSSLM